MLTSAAMSQPIRSLTKSICLLLTVLAIASCGGAPATSEALAGAASAGGMHVVIDTDKGPIEIEFLAADSPKAVENFRLLAGRGYYDGLIFHRVVSGFMIQGGDPTGTGSGGESAWGADFADDINATSALYRAGYPRGTVAMANAGPNTNGSQFFIVHQDAPLPPNYVIFGRVTNGMDAVDAIATTQTTLGADGAMSKPVAPQIMKKVTVRP